MTTPETPPPATAILTPRPRPRGAGSGRKALGALLIVILIWSFLGFLALNALRNGLLSSDTYTSALDENHVYDRVYSELLNDPDLLDTHGQLVGDIKIPTDEATATLREVLPPDYLRKEVDGAVKALVAYARGETATPNVVIHLGPVLQRIPTAATAAMDRQIDRAEMVTVTSDAQYGVMFQDGLAALKEGNPPTKLPSIASLSAPQQQSLAEMLLPAGAAGADPAATAKIRADILAALAQGDSRAALKAAAAQTLQPLFDEAFAGVREHLDANDNFDLVDQLAQENDQTREEFVADAAPFQDASSNASGSGYWGAMLVMLLATAGLVALFMPDRAAMLRWPGLGFLFAGGIGLGLYFALRWVLGFAADQVDPLGDSGAPAAAEQLALDITRSLIRGAADSMLLPAAVTAIAGVGLIVASIAVGRMQRVTA